MSPKLTVGMATFNDYDGVYFSLQALRMYHSHLLPRLELLVIDNSPTSPHGEAVRKFCERIHCKYIPFTEWSGTTVKDQVFKNAETDYVLCMDCHVLLPSGSLDYLLHYLDFNPKCKDLLQGPLLFDNFRVAATHLKLQWRGEMWGIWATDEAGTKEDSLPFEIPAQGMGVFACRRDAWPGFNPAFRGFGGEEGYIHEKFRQRGGKVMCLPGLRWLHRFDRPSGVPYRLKSLDKFRNYLIGYKELGLDTQEVIDHFAEKVPKARLDTVINEILKPTTPKPEQVTYQLL